MSNIKVCLDAGHYGKYNQSPAVETYYESDMNWKLHLMLKEELEKYGVEVITTRDDQQTDKPLFERGETSQGCDLFLSIHSNSSANGDVKETVDRPVAIVQLDGMGDELGQLLANCVARVMETKQAGQFYSRSGSRGEYYGVLRGAAAVGTMGILLEHSFHTNTRSTLWLLDDSNLRKLAVNEAKVIYDYFTERKEARTVDIQLKVLRKGENRGDPQIQNLQRILKDMGYYDMEVDGSFGGGTQRAVKAFQEDRAIDIDGIVGRETWIQLLTK
ncbi:MAG: N-acetylmuramoyl-L-alanine amidase [Clostridia bacterium]|nr:N-acetylmuramoyl-L-alanine amidase [Clostridia bacterium]